MICTGLLHFPFCNCSKAGPVYLLNIGHTYCRKFLLTPHENQPTFKILLKVFHVPVLVSN